MLLIDYAWDVLRLGLQEVGDSDPREGFGVWDLEFRLGLQRVDDVDPLLNECERARPCPSPVNISIQTCIQTLKMKNSSVWLGYVFPPLHQSATHPIKKSLTYGSQNLSAQVTSTPSCLDIELTTQVLTAFSIISCPSSAMTAAVESKTDLPSHCLRLWREVFEFVSALLWSCPNAL